MKFNKWTVGLAAIGVVSLASAARADEKMSQVQTALSNTTLSGYVDTSVMWNTGSQNGGNIPPYTPGLAKGDGFNLNAVDLTLDKPLDESPWAAGYHIDLMLGQDRVGTGNGIRQAYVALRTPVGNSGIDWKMGVWDSPLGYESSSDPLNPNFTRSYGYQFEPTTFTGLLGTFKANDVISFSAGVANSYGAGFLGSSGGGNALNGGFGAAGTYESQKAYLGMLTLTAPDSVGWMKGATFTAGALISDAGSSPNGAGVTRLYAGATVPTPATALKVGMAFDYSDFHNGASKSANPADDSLWVAGLYANFQANDKLSFNVRGEFVDLENTAFSHTGEELTGTISYQLWANVLSRVEVRWDHAGVQFYDNNYLAGGALNGPLHRNEILVALNLIYQF
jgi:hypothetical protein